MWTVSVDAVFLALGCSDQIGGREGGRKMRRRVPLTLAFALSVRTSGAGMALSRSWLSSQVAAADAAMSPQRLGTLPSPGCGESSTAVRSELLARFAVLLHTFLIRPLIETTGRGIQSFHR